MGGRGQRFVRFNLISLSGPDNPLALGIVDRFEAEGLRIRGPNQKAAQFEASKVFAHQFMERHGIPTARAGCFTDAEEARPFAASLPGGCAVKADGVALGKGVLICRTPCDSSSPSGLPAKNSREMALRAPRVTPLLLCAAGPFR